MTEQHAPTINHDGIVWIRPRGSLSTDPVAIESRCRRLAKRQGLILKKSRVRDRRDPGYGRFHLLTDRNAHVAENLTIEAIEALLKEREGHGHD